MAARIDVETEPGQFTEFTIVLPRKQSTNQSDKGSDVNVLVLVVDDEPDVEALFRQQFRRDLRAQRFVMDFAIRRRTRWRASPAPSSSR